MSALNFDLGDDPEEQYAMQEKLASRQGIPMKALGYYGVRQATEEDDGSESGRRSRRRAPVMGDDDDEDQNSDSERGEDWGADRAKKRQRSESDHVPFIENFDERLSRSGREAGLPDDDGSQAAEDDGGGSSRWRRCEAPDIVEVRNSLGIPAPQTKCVGCIYSNPMSGSVTYEDITTMEQMFNAKLNTTDLIALCKLLELFYEEKIRKKANKNRKVGEPELPEWKAATIYYHYMYHCNEFTVRMSGLCKMWMTMIEKQYVSNTWVQGKIGKKVVEIPTEDGIKKMKDLTNILLKIYNQKPRTAMFSAAIGTTQEDARPMLNINKRKMHMANAAALTGTSLASRNKGGGGTIQGAGKSNNKR